MWASKLASIGPDWQTLLDYSARKAGKSARNQEIAQSAVKLLKHTRFKKVAKIDTGLLYGPNFDEIVYDFARARKLNVVQLKGNTDIVERCYHKAKSSVHKRIAE